MPETPLDEWEKDKSGALIARPLLGWSTIGATDGASGVLRLEYAMQSTPKERAALQVHVSATQVRDLAEGLTRLAIYLEGARATKKKTD